MDHATMKLGKHPPKLDRRTLRLARYLLPNLPPPPPTVDYTGGITSWGMMENDKLGDCTIAAIGHAVQTWTLACGSELTLDDSVIVSYYSKWAGYNPADQSTDGGAVELDILNQWRKEPFSGHQLHAYADVFPKFHDYVKHAINIFGGIYVGLNLPVSASRQAAWTVVSGPEGESGSWGGHAVWVPKYEPDGLTCITWGGLQKMTWEFWNAYCDESHVLFSLSFLTTAGATPGGVDQATLEKDLNYISA